MKKILITGANSYIGTSFEEWIKKWTGRYSVSTLSLRNTSYLSGSYSGYDVVFHVAGIAHVYAKNTDDIQELYYKINRDLAIETAKKMKEDGVRQFIFMSSIIVYGDGSFNHKKVITKDTVPEPSNYYGNSKLQAEKGILELQSDDFKVVVIRSPMVYGKDSKGNYPKLSKYAKKLFLFPYIKNERSMIHIDNLCEFLRLIIDHEECGIFHPQNSEYICTSELIKLIAEVNGKSIKLTKFLNPFLELLPIYILNKVFGTLVYDKDLSKYKYNYSVHDLYDTIKLTEGQ